MRRASSVAIPPHRSLTDNPAAGDTHFHGGVDGLGKLSANPDSGLVCDYPAGGLDRPHAPMLVNDVSVINDAVSDPWPELAIRMGIFQPFQEPVVTLTGDGLH